MEADAARPAAAAPPFDRPALARLGTLLVLAAFAFSAAVIGGVEIWAQSVMGRLTLAAFLVFLVARRLHPLAGDAPERGVRLRLPEVLLLGLLLLGLVQIAPLPRGLLWTLSPEAARVAERGLPPGEDASWRSLSVYPFATRVELLRFAALAMVFSMFARGLRGTSEARFALGGFAALGALAALLSILDPLVGGDLLGYYPRENRHTERLAGVLVNPNHFAGMMTMTALAVLGLYFSVVAGGEGRGAREEEGLREAVARGIEAGANRGAAVGILLAFLLATVALFLTVSRLGIFSFLVGVGVFGALIAARGGSARRPLLGLAAITVLVLVVNGVLSADPVLRRFSLFFDGLESGEGRVRAFGATAAMGSRFLLFGSGLGTFGHLFPAYQPTELRGTWDHAHNDFLQFFADGGLVGCLLAAGFLAAWAAPVARTALAGPWRRRGLAAGVLAAVAALLVHATGDFNFQIPGNAYLLVALMGIGYAAAAGSGPTSPVARAEIH